MGIATAAAVAMLGCGDRPTPSMIVPDSDTCRRAIEAAMASWRAGRPTGVIESAEPRIQVIDAHRRPGQRLEGYEILSETASPRERSFSVRLDLSGPDEGPIVRYLVMGFDPVLVFRQEDFDLMMHWEHKMEPDAEATGDPPR